MYLLSKAVKDNERMRRYSLVFKVGHIKVLHSLAERNLTSFIPLLTYSSEKDKMFWLRRIRILSWLGSILQERGAGIRQAQAQSAWESEKWVWRREGAAFKGIELSKSQLCVFKILSVVSEVKLISPFCYSPVHFNVTGPWI